LQLLYLLIKKLTKILDDSRLSNVGESAIGAATQLKPQVIDVQLRPGLLFNQREFVCSFIIYLSN